ncbi:aminotransferase class V-fold PLP-dependent enzyme [Pseudonocardia sp. CA-107938]|uniref:aminotransferase class V-fold PLP-dependent enzyme n=1 Tax=Pseudonocardia sp. CA-107938 TaxID=3240021 RepID=UPI003D8A8A6B
MRKAFGEQFDVPDGYLNTASIGIPPAVVADAVAAAVEDWRRGVASPPDYDPAIATARAAFAELVGVPHHRVAIGSAVSPLVAQIAASLPDGARVVVRAGDFTSVTFPFAAQAGRGVVVDEVPDAELAERAADADLVAVSVVQSADGALADLAALREVQAAGTTVVLDVSQALGWLDADVSWADVVVGASYKWLLAPRGAAWLAVSDAVRERVVPHQAGWFAGDDPWDTVYGLPLRLAPDARALDISPVWFAHVGAAVALPWLATLDRAAVHAHCVGLADALRAELGLPPAGSAIVSVAGAEVGERLAAAGVRSSVRAGAVRLGFHLYNDENDLDRVVAALR